MRDKFWSQSEIAEALGVRRSLVDRQCRRLGLGRIVGKTKILTEPEVDQLIRYRSRPEAVSLREKERTNRTARETKETE